MNVTWHSVDFASGRRGPQVTTRSLGSVSRIIGEPTDASIDVLVWDEVAQAPVPGWDAATLPGRVMLVAVDDLDRPLWGGLVVRRAGQDATAWVSCYMSTVESYLDRRFVGDMAFTQTDQADIAADLLAAVAADVPSMRVDSVATGVLRDRTYADDDDKTYLSVLQELMDVAGGCEFTADLQWADESHTLLEIVWVVRGHIGQASTATFEMPGSITSYSYVEDYTVEQGANDVMASSSGEGDTRPESDHQTDIPAGWVRFEHRFSPTTSIKRVERLNEHAAARLARMRDGASELTFEAHLDFAPMPGVDFHLGDDVRVVISSPRFPAYTNSDSAVVPGLVKTMRVVGYTLDFDGNRLIPLTVEVA